MSAGMKERPILFTGAMVRALLAGTKTQTRRVVTGRALDWLAPDMFSPSYVAENGPCPYGRPGDRLWVRETWLPYHETGLPFHRNCATIGPYAYRADFDADREDICLGHGYRWRPSIHMPRWASRLTLEITGVRVERVQAITEGDARAEGITDGGCLECGESEPCGCGNPMPCARDAFVGLWDSINTPRGHGWDTDPWVWAITFRRVEATP